MPCCTATKQICAAGPAAPDGAFYVYPSCAGLIGRVTLAGKALATDLDVAMYFLEAAGVAVLDGGAYGLSHYLRLSIAVPVDVIEAACARLAEACATLCPGADAQAHPARLLA